MGRARRRTDFRAGHGSGDIDGTFLQRAELDGLWDEMIYIDTDPRIARARAVQRAAALFGGPQAVERIYRTRYHAACALYADDADPVRRAGILIDNNDLNHPFVRRTTDCRGRAVRAD